MFNEKNENNGCNENNETTYQFSTSPNIVSLLDYNTRINFIDKCLSFITDNDISKFYILSFFHNLSFFILYLVLFFTTSPFYLSICLIITAIQLILNIMDNGCFLMKLERKYIGKWWFGGYTCLKYIHPSLLDKKYISKIFYSLVITIFTLSILKLYYLL